MGLLKSAVQQCAFKRPAANTGGSSKRPKQADKKEQRLSTKAPGPNTLGGLFSWPYKVLGRLRMSPLWNTFARNMAAGLVVHSDHSGSGNGEEGLRDIIETSETARPAWSPWLQCCRPWPGGPGCPRISVLCQALVPQCGVAGAGANDGTGAPFASGGW